jgi:hypothetical protein
MTETALTAGARRAARLADIEQEIHDEGILRDEFQDRANEHHLRYVNLMRQKVAIEDLLTQPTKGAENDTRKE